MMSCPDFEPGTPLIPLTLAPQMQATEDSGIAAIPWVYEGLQRDVIECCLMSPCTR